jgi:hypothetical protein
MREHRDGPEIHDAKADPAWTGGRLVRIERTGRPVRSASPGWWVTACQPGAMGNTGSPSAVAGDRLGHPARWASGHRRVAEGLVVPLKPGNAGGGKGPWFQGADGAAREGGD